MPEIPSQTSPVSTPRARRAGKSRSRRAVTVVAWAVPAALVLGAGGYVAAAAAAPLPEPTFAALADSATTVTADQAHAQAAVDEQTLPTAIGWLHGSEVWTNDETAYSLASISKLITVLVCQDAQPLAPGADGPVYTWTQEDVERQKYYLSLDGVAYPIPAGTQLTLRQMLTFIFLPSSNDYAAAYAYSVFGDNETFLAAVRDWAGRNGISSLEFVEPTGMDEGNKASAADLLRVGRIALNNPTIAEFTRMPSAVMPWGVGLIENTNPLLTELPGMLGVKTGRSESAGFNYIAAQKTSVDGREAVKMSVTLGRPSKAARAQSGRDMLGAIEALPQETTLVTEGEPVGEITAVDGSQLQLIATETATATLFPGEQAKREVVLAEDADAGISAGAAGEIVVTSPSGEVRVPIRFDGALTEPDLWWRITHPTVLFS